MILGFSMYKNMRIGIDARFYGRIGRGLGRYTEQLILGLEKIGGRDEYFIFLRQENFDAYRPKNRRFHKVLADIPWYGWREQIFFPLLLRKYRLDLMHFLHFNVPVLFRKKFIVTIHDLILLHYPTVRATTLHPLYYWIKFFIYRFVLWRAIRNSDHIIAVSEFTRRDILSQYSVHPKKVSVTYEANSDFLGESALACSNVLERYGIISPYLLYVGNAYPHKNLDALLGAFARIGRDDIQLILVGKTDFFYDALRHRAASVSNVLFLDDVHDDELACLYAYAELFVYPSLYEGFGLPPLEAMARGTIVASSDAASLPEILGDACLFFHPEESEDMVRVLQRALALSDAERKVWKARGAARASRYNWNDMVRKTVRLYKQCGGCSK